MNKSSLQSNCRWLVLLLAVLAPAAAHAQNPAQDKDQWYGYYPESYARATAIKTVMPTYPAEAISHRIFGVVQVKIAVNAQGEVVKMRMSPVANPLLKKAVAQATQQWAFKPRTDPERTDQLSMMHLTFRFWLKGGPPTVGLYDAAPGAPDSQAIGYLNSAKEAKEWTVWDEVPIEK